MPLYMYQAAYTNESWATQVSKRENVAERVRPLLAALGGQLQHVWYAFGEYDVVAIVELPNNEAAAALAMALARGGSVKTAKTTPLMAIDQGLQAMSLAADVVGQYRPPVS
jgi:uncharacterized protein with GYD domain